MVFVGIDWSEKHHDFCIVDQEGEIYRRKHALYLVGHGKNFV